MLKKGVRIIYNVERSTSNWRGVLQTGEEYFIFEVLLSRMVERSTSDNDMNLRIWYKTLDEVLLKRGRTSPTQLQVHLSSCLSTPIRACEERCTQT